MSTMRAEVVKAATALHDTNPPSPEDRRTHVEALCKATCEGATASILYLLQKNDYWTREEVRAFIERVCRCVWTHRLIAFYTSPPPWIEQEDLEPLRIRLELPR